MRAKMKEKVISESPQGVPRLENLHNHRHLLSLFLSLHLAIISLRWTLLSLLPKWGVRPDNDTFHVISNCSRRVARRDGKSLLIGQWTGQVTQEGTPQFIAVTVFLSTARPQSSRNGVSLHKGRESTGSSKPSAEPLGLEPWNTAQKAICRNVHVMT